MNTFIVIFQGGRRIGVAPSKSKAIQLCHQCHISGEVVLIHKIADDPRGISREVNAETVTIEALCPA